MCGLYILGALLSPLTHDIMKIGLNCPLFQEKIALLTKNEKYTRACQIYPSFPFHPPSHVTLGKVLISLGPTTRHLVRFILLYYRLLVVLLVLVILVLACFQLFFPSSPAHPSSQAKLIIPYPPSPHVDVLKEESGSWTETELRTCCRLVKLARR